MVPRDDCLIHTYASYNFWKVAMERERERIGREAGSFTWGSQPKRAQQIGGIDKPQWQMTINWEVISF